MATGWVPPVDQTGRVPANEPIDFDGPEWRAIAARYPLDQRCGPYDDEEPERRAKG